MTELIAFITENWQSALAIVGAFAIIATSTPNKSDDRIVQGILDVMNFLGANMGKAKNG